MALLSQSFPQIRLTRVQQGLVVGPAGVGNRGQTRAGTFPIGPIPTCLEAVSRARLGTGTGSSLSTASRGRAEGAYMEEADEAAPHSLAVFTEVRSVSEQTVSLGSQAPVGVREVAEEDWRQGWSQSGLSKQGLLVH